MFFVIMFVIAVEDGLSPSFRSMWITMSSFVTILTLYRDKFIATWVRKSLAVVQILVALLMSDRVI